jgi:hypothetical protein
VTEYRDQPFDPSGGIKAAESSLFQKIKSVTVRRCSDPRAAIAATDRMADWNNQSWPEILVTAVVCINMFQMATDESLGLQNG